MAAARDEITFNPQLFARIEAVYNAREQAGLTAEQKRLLERTYEDFVRQGARLSPEQKQQLGEINQKLASLFTEFSNRLLADEDTWITLEKPEDLAGLSDSLKASFSAAAEERGLKGKWAVVNTRSSVDPFLTFSARRDLRERVWKAFKSRGDNNDAHDTKTTIAAIVKLRADRAKLLGYTSHAHWHMADSMAKQPEKAKELMLKVWPAAVARVREEVADMQKIADREPGKPKIAAWDYLFYAEKVRKAKYDLDQNQLKPYFELGKLIQGAFYMAEQLYGLKFREITGTVPALTPETRVWEVTQGAGDEHVGLFYGDYFARAAKRSGAWCSEYRSHETFTGNTRHTITSNNNNFVKAAASEPVLISLDDAQTLYEVVKVFGRQAEARKVFDERNDDLFNSAFKAQFISGVIQPVMMFVSNLNYVLVAVIGGLRVASGSLSIGDVQAFIQYSRQFMQPLTQVASMMNLLQSGVASAERVFELLDADEQIPDSTTAVPTEGPGEVRFEHVSFSYDPAEPLIEDLSLVASPGQTVAIVGPTGAGKTIRKND